MLRGPRPKLTLSVPPPGKTSPTGSSGSALTINITAALNTPLSPRSPILSAASARSAVTPLTQAARNALLNQQGHQTLQVPSFAYANTHFAKSILKRDIGTRAVLDARISDMDGRSLRFNEVPAVKCISPLPSDCHGGYAKMSREERRWRTSDC